MAFRFSDEAAATALLEDIKDNKYPSNTAYSLLNQIIIDLPGTWVAQQAQKIKEERY